jgi:uncharacterized protein YegL
MAYTAEISRNNPTCLVFMIDQSGSMADALPDGSGQKANAVADAINKLLQNFIVRNTATEVVYDRFHISVIGYGTTVGPAFGGALKGEGIVPLSVIAEHPRMESRMKKMSDGAGGVFEQQVTFPVWFDPIANGSTPMGQAFDQAAAVVSGWLSAHPGCFPPIVLNISDGEPDADPTSEADRLKRLSSNDGEVLVFNAHVSSEGGAPIKYPESDAGLPNPNAKLLYKLSSVLPQKMRDLAKPEFQLPENSRGFVYNGDLVDIINFLDIGTRVAAR